MNEKRESNANGQNLLNSISKQRLRNLYSKHPEKMLPNVFFSKKDTQKSHLRNTHTILKPWPVYLAVWSTITGAQLDSQPHSGRKLGYLEHAKNFAHIALTIVLIFLAFKVNYSGKPCLN